MRADPTPKFRVSSVSGTRDRRGQNMPPPGRVILRPSPEDMLTLLKIVSHDPIDKVIELPGKVDQETCVANDKKLTSTINMIYRKYDSDAALTISAAFSQAATTRKTHSFV